MSQRIASIVSFVCLALLIAVVTVWGPFAKPASSDGSSSNARLAAASPAEVAQPALELIREFFQLKASLVACQRVQDDLLAVHSTNLDRYEAQRQVVGTLKKQFESQVVEASDSNDDVLKAFAPAYETRARLEAESVIWDEIAEDDNRSGEICLRAIQSTQAAKLAVGECSERVHSEVVTHLLMEGRDKPMMSDAVVLVVREIEKLCGNSDAVAEAIKNFELANEKFLRSSRNHQSLTPGYKQVLDVPARLEKNKSKIDKLLSKPRSNNFRGRLEEIRMIVREDKKLAEHYKVVHEKYSDSQRESFRAWFARADAFVAIMEALR